MRFLKMYLIAIIVFLIIDGIWLTLIAKGFYKDRLGFLFSDTPNYIAAGIFYVIFIVGLVYFVIKPGIESSSIQTILLGGALFGLVSYATYDLTNLATITDWPLSVTIVDLIWGSFLSTAVALSTYLIYPVVFG